MVEKVSLNWEDICLLCLMIDTAILITYCVKKRNLGITRTCSLHTERRYLFARNTLNKEESLKLAVYSSNTLSNLMQETSLDERRRKKILFTRHSVYDVSRLRQGLKSWHFFKPDSDGLITDLKRRVNQDRKRNVSIPAFALIVGPSSAAINFVGFVWGYKAWNVQYVSIGKTRGRYLCTTDILSLYFAFG